VENGQEFLEQTQKMYLYHSKKEGKARIVCTYNCRRNHPEHY